MLPFQPAGTEGVLLALEVLERCVGVRLLQEHRSRQQAALQRAHTPGRADGGESAAAAQREAAAATAAAREREAAAEQALLSASEAQQVAREQARPLICIPSISLSTPLISLDLPHALCCEQVERAQAELQTLRSQNQTLLAVVSCQAATIEQVTAGGQEQALEREASQQRLLAQQSEQLAAIQSEVLRLRRDSGGGARRDSGGAGGAGGGAVPGAAAVSTEAEVLVQQQQAELQELRLQQQGEKHAHEAALAEARRQARGQSERAGQAERRATQLEREVEALSEQAGQAAEEAGAARQELARLREVERRFSEIAAEMGCVDEQGRLMQARVEALTGELLQARRRRLPHRSRPWISPQPPPPLWQARLDEAQHLQWLKDIKSMMASGAEDGLAMALAQTMEESHRKDQLLKQKEAELKALRGGNGSAPSSGRSKPPLPTAPVRPASATSARSASSSNRSTSGRNRPTR